MKIGLMRHLPVIHSHKAFMTSNEFNLWQKGYDTADVKDNSIIMDETIWGKCYCSDLPRAVTTAKKVYTDELIRTNLLREIEIAAPFDTSIKLPFIIWTILGRSAWYFSHKSQRESYNDTLKRAESIINNILEEDTDNLNVLIVSHGALMYYMRKVLLQKDFNGPSFTKAKNGELYVFEK